MQQSLSSPFQVKQLLLWEFHITVQAPASRNHQFLGDILSLPKFEKPEDILEKHVRALVFLLISAILL